MTDRSIPSKPLRIMVLLASVVAGVGGAAGLYVAVAEASAVLWASVGFLGVLLISSVLGVVAGTGRFASGYGMATLSIAGGIAGSALFAWRDLASNVGRDPQIGPVLLPWLGFEAVCGVVIVGAGAIVVLMRRSGSFGAIWRGLAFLVPAGVILGVGYLGWGRVPTEDSGRVVALSLLLVGGIVIGALFSVGGHFLIRAFERTADDAGGSASE